MESVRYVCNLMIITNLNNGNEKFMTYSARNKDVGT